LHLFGFKLSLTQRSSIWKGFASGSLDADAQPVRMFVADGGECFIAQSYAKNMGLYGERVGALSIVREFYLFDTGPYTVHTHTRVCVRALLYNCGSFIDVVLSERSLTSVNQHLKLRC